MSQMPLSVDFRLFSPQRASLLGAEAVVQPVDDRFACPTAREDKRMADMNCIPICPKSPQRAQHSPGSMPSVNVTAGGCFKVFPETCEKIAKRLRRLAGGE
jgi:hypothetical protein